VIAKRGWIARKTTEISLGRVEGVEISQSIVERMFNFGDILVSGVGSHKARIDDVSDPMSFRKALLTSLGQFEKTGHTEKMEKTKGDDRSAGAAEIGSETFDDQKGEWAGVIRVKAKEGPIHEMLTRERSGVTGVDDGRGVSRMHAELLGHLETDSTGKMRAKSEELLVQFVLQQHERHPELERILEINDGELSRFRAVTGLAEQMGARV
jgi:hypothetical protein